MHALRTACLALPVLIRFAVKIHIQPTVVLVSTRIDEAVDALLQHDFQDTDMCSDLGRLQ